MIDPRHYFLPMFLHNSDPASVAAAAAAAAMMPGFSTPPNLRPHIPTLTTVVNDAPTTPRFRISDILDTKPKINGNSDRPRVDHHHRILNDPALLSPTVNDEDNDCSSPSPSDKSSSDQNRLSSSGGVGGKKARKARTIFTDKQLQELETTFDKQKYLSVQDRMELAQRMSLSDTQVKTWYQNRRTKWKRQSAVGLELLNEASNLAAVQQLLRQSPYWASYFSSSQLQPPPGCAPPRFWPPGNFGTGQGGLPPTSTPNLPLAIFPFPPGGSPFGMPNLVPPPELEAANRSPAIKED